MRSESPEISGRIPKTPIEPVSVCGSATIQSAPDEMRYPPEAAYSPIETTTLTPFFCRASISLLMSLEANTSPPGELSLSTTALTRLSFCSFLRRGTMVSDVIPSSADLVISPSAVTTAMIFLELFIALAASFSVVREMPFDEMYSESGVAFSGSTPNFSFI